MNDFSNKSCPLLKLPLFFVAPEDNLRNRRTNTSGQRTENIGGKSPMNVYEGNVRIKGDVNIKHRGHANEGNIL